jgi:hypothetical protein
MRLGGGLVASIGAALEDEWSAVAPGGLPYAAQDDGMIAAVEHRLSPAQEAREAAVE